MNPQRIFVFSIVAAVALFLSSCTKTSKAEVSLPNIFSDHMVLQRDAPIPVWGRSDPGASIKLKLAQQTVTTQADEDGKWKAFLEPMPAGGPHTLTVNATTFSDVLVGEVWVAAGQSNMEWPLVRAKGAEVEIAAANHPNIRLITVPRLGSQQPQDNFEGAWSVCSPEAVADHSAIAYYFGRTLQGALDVPIGLIDTPWGGSSAEAWVPRDVLEQYSEFSPYLEEWKTRLADYTDDSFQQEVREWKQKVEEWKSNGKQGRKPREPHDPRYDRHRPANIYNGVAHPIIGYGIRGFIWYQGESNSSRHQTYRQLMTVLIKTYRDQWGVGEFPFYWVQLADYREPQLHQDNSTWAFLREAQSQTLDVPHTGQAVIIDSGETNDIHPRDKYTVASRLSRWALANDYGFDMNYRSPSFASMKIEDSRVVLKFSNVSADGLRCYDSQEVIGFVMAGADQVFHPAAAEITANNEITLTCPEVSKPVAVRYGWADNPICNVQDHNRLPLTPFRTDDWAPVISK